jgi:hypothetical protein
LAKFSLGTQNEAEAGVKLSSGPLEPGRGLLHLQLKQILVGIEAKHIPLKGLGLLKSRHILSF